MLELLRENVRSFHWILWLVILTFVLGFVVMSPDFGRAGVGGGAAVASVAGVEITREDWNREFDGLEMRYRQIYGQRFSREVAQQLNLPLQALRAQVTKKIYVHEAEKLGLSITNSELLERILEDPSFTDDSGKFVGQKRYQEILRQSRFRNAAVFEDLIREEMTVEKLNAVMAANVFVPDSAVEADFRREAEKARIRFLELPGSRFAGEVTVTPAEVQSYFETRKEDYRKPEQRVASYLLVNTTKLRTGIQVSEADIQAYYDQNKAEFTQEEQVRARHILLKVDDNRSEEAARSELEAAKRRVEGGADFATLAKELSEDPGSKDRGGDLSYFGRGKMIPEFENAAFGVSPAVLAQVRAGQAKPPLVGPISTSFGVHLLQVLDRKEAGVQPLSLVQNQVRVRIQGEKAQQLAEERAAALVARIKRDKLTTDEQWKTVLEGVDYLSQQKTPAFGEQDPVAQIGRVPELNAAVFALKPGEVAEAIKVPVGWVIARLDEIKPPRVPELSEVEAQVRQALQRKKQEERASAQLALSKAQLSAGKTLDAVAAELGVEVRDSGEFGAGQPITGLGANNALAEAALAAKVGEVGGPIATRQGAVLFQVTERKSWDPAEFAKNKDEVRARLEAQQVQRLMASLVEGHYRRGEVREDLASLGITPPTTPQRP